MSSTTSAELLAAVRDHFIKPGEERPGAVFLTEVTAPDRVHRADAVHVGLWASRGYTVDVCELKVSRSDFQRELDNPAKAEAWWAHSNTFWIVAPDTAVAPPELLPAGWGLMVPGGRGRRFKTVVKAEHRELSPSTALLAALLVSMETDRTKALYLQRSQLTAQHSRAIEQERLRATAEGDPSLRRRIEVLDQLEKAAGVRLDSYLLDSVSPAALGESLRRTLAEGRVQRDIGWSLESVASAIGRMQQALDEAHKTLGDAADGGVR